MEEKKPHALWRVNIVKSLGLSKLINSASVLVIPEQLINEINSLIQNFIWDGKSAKIKKSTIIGEKKQGGLKMTHFNIMNKALKFAWIPRIRAANEASWKIIPEAALDKHGGLSFLTNCNYDVRTLQADNLSSFYLEVLKEWKITKDCMRTGTSSISEEIIWNNRNILINGKPLFNKSWFDKNILKIKDLLQHDGNFLSFKNFCDKFKLKTPFTFYFGIVSTIPTSWKDSVKISPLQFFRK